MYPSNIAEFAEMQRTHRIFLCYLGLQAALRHHKVGQARGWSRPQILCIVVVPLRFDHFTISITSSRKQITKFGYFGLLVIL